MTPLKPYWPGPILGGMKVAPRIARRHPMRRADERSRRHDEHDDDNELDANDDVVGARGFVDADDEQCRNGGDDRHRRDIHQRAGRVPGPLGRIIGKWRLGIGRGNGNADILEKAHDIARPADRDGGSAKRVFEDQVPADDPGDDFAHGGVGVGVGAAGNRHRRSHLRIAEAGKGAGKRAKDKGQRDRRAGISRRGMSGQHENAGTDDGPDAERHEVDGGERALERHAVMRGQRLHFRLRGFRLQSRNRFAHPDFRHHGDPSACKPAAASAACCRLATRSSEKCSIASLNRR